MWSAGARRKNPGASRVAGRAPLVFLRTPSEGRSSLLVGLYDRPTKLKPYLLDNADGSSCSTLLTRREAEVQRRDALIKSTDGATVHDAVAPSELHHKPIRPG